jgi:hypothetical protein|tara:strand:+ start:526 stop:675 length:150 start_codon:yes stop_codon:yes gene_type:complete
MFKEKEWWLDLPFSFAVFFVGPYAEHEEEGEAEQACEAKDPAYGVAEDH